MDLTGYFLQCARPHPVPYSRPAARRGSGPHNGGHGATTRASGDHYLIDPRRNAVVAQGVDLKALGKKLGALKPYESLEGA
jgi:hypothetical protein